MNIDDIIQQRRDWRRNIPDLRNGAYRKLYDKAMGGRSMRAAVSSKCLDCMCWQKNEVRDCDIVSCPLHPYRPYKGRSARQRASGGGFSERTHEKAVDMPLLKEFAAKQAALDDTQDLAEELLYAEARMGEDLAHNANRKPITDGSQKKLSE